MSDPQVRYNALIGGLIIVSKVEPLRNNLIRIDQAHIPAEKGILDRKRAQILVQSVNLFAFVLAQSCVYRIRECFAVGAIDDYNDQSFSSVKLVNTTANLCPQFCDVKLV